MPWYVANGEGNYTSDMRTVLRVYVALNYASVDDKRARV
jgi:hypothetical protein